MNRIIISSLCILLISLLGVMCSQKKPYVWKGKYSDVTTSDLPKEDFKVFDNTVISYAPCEHDVNAEVLYKFALTKGGKQYGLVFLEELPGFGYLLYYELYSGKYINEKNKSLFFLSENGYTTLRMYQSNPGYEQLKCFVIARLASNHELRFSPTSETGDSIQVKLLEDGTWMFMPPSRRDIRPAQAESGDSVTMEVVDYSEVERKPKPVSIPQPIYPDLAKKASIEGTTVVIALLDIDGSMSEVRIMKSSGNGLLDLAALQAAMHARFTPAMQRGQYVRVWVSMPMKFRLAE